MQIRKTGVRALALAGAAVAVSATPAMAATLKVDNNPATDCTGTFTVTSIWRQTPRRRCARAAASS